MTPAPVLSVRGLTMDFGGLRALSGVSLQVEAGRIVALIGPNGAGKTTFFNCVTGLYTPKAGEIFLTPPGRTPIRIDGMKTHRITRSGLSRTFQNIRIFPAMTVLENVMIGRHCRTDAGLLAAVLRGRKTCREERAIAESSYALLERMGLAAEVNELAGSLSYGAQRRLEIARALATEPFLLLLDEPAAGMNPRETAELEDMIRGICTEDQMAILLIEHDMRIVMSVSDHIVVLDYGERIAEGTAGEIRGNPLVIKAYLGEDEEG